MVAFKMGNKQSNRKTLFLGISLGVLLTAGILLLWHTYLNNSGEVNHDAKNKIIIVDKQKQKLKVYDAFFGEIKSFKISTGENPGNKLMKGDLKTPEGIFPVIGVEDASDWTYDFKDGKGDIRGAYGPLFFRLKVDSQNIFYNVNTDFDFSSNNEFEGIGIHGTHLNNLLGIRSSHGCIRLKNEDLLDLKKYITAGTLVAILPGKNDNNENIKLRLHKSLIEKPKQ
jgi:hypothetical protein